MAVSPEHDGNPIILENYIASEFMIYLVLRQLRPTAPL
jgi:hypothetical protein